MTDREQMIIEKLGLKHLNLEAGLFSLVTESALEVISDNERVAASNLIYLMLNKDEPINYVQRLASDDYQILIEGGPADYFLFYADGTTESFTMGRNLNEGEQLVVAAPGGTAKAIVLHDDADYLLAASVVTPAWTPTRVEIGGDDTFITQYAGSSSWATAEKIRELIGPDFGRIVGGQATALNLSVDDDGQIIFLGMQLSAGQARKEFERFSNNQPGVAATLTVSPNAHAQTVQLIESIAAELNVALERTP